MSFDERKKALENKYARDEEARFRLNSRAVRLLGLWAAAELKITGEAAKAYADEVVDSDFDEPGIQDVLRKIGKDFAARGLKADPADLERRYLRHLEEAREKH